MSWFTGFTAAALSVWAVQAPVPSLDQQVRAAFILNFVDYASWPSGASRDLVLCMLVGDTRVLDAATAAVSADSTGRRQLSVRRLTSPSDVTGCAVLFVGKDRRDQWPAVRTQAVRGILTIGEDEGFLDHGGVINLLQVGTRIRFEINLREANRRGIRLSAKLLRLATRVVQDDN